MPIISRAAALRMLPETTRAVVLKFNGDIGNGNDNGRTSGIPAPVQKRGSGKENDNVFDIAVEDRKIEALRPGQVLVKMGAISLNHRDLWIRRRKYPLIAPNSVLGSCGAGRVVAAFNEEDSLLGKHVFLSPMRGWQTDPLGPENSAWFGVLGGVTWPLLGTFSEYVAVDRDQVLPSPRHLDDVHMAAFPLAGLTAWRVVMVHGKVSKGDNVLITGIGGGVATLALQFCLSQGANVFVTSSSQEKINQAVKLGAVFGDSYLTDKWTRTIKAKLVERTGRHTLDCVITGNGGNIMHLTSKLVKPGGKVIVYGMAQGDPISFTMREVMAGKQLIGSSMGSLRDLQDATSYIAQHKITPIVSAVFDASGGPESGKSNRMKDKMEEAFTMMSNAGQFGKIVVVFDRENEQAKL